jgi:hypothetical protein
MLSVSVFFFLTQMAWAWGRHDLITAMAVNTPELSYLKSTAVTPEPIEKAAPDLLRRVMPGLLKWCQLYHLEHDARYEWSPPEDRAELSAPQRLLWELEDNVSTPLQVGSEKTAADILIKYVSEPDDELDGSLNEAPYLARLKPSMSYFYEEGSSHTHAFRHYYVPTSLAPPILAPRGVAPGRAALYSELARGAFQTGHPYWGFRFLAWSIHYLQDVTQPWHTVFLPGLSFLKWNRAQMRHEVASLHYLTEAMADSWLLAKSPLLETRARLYDPEWKGRWGVAELAEKLAGVAHAKALRVAELGRTLFTPVVQNLSAALRPTVSQISWGKIEFPTLKLDFSGDGKGATQFLAPLWSPSFGLAETRDQLVALLSEQIAQAAEGSRSVMLHFLAPVLPVTPQPAR